MKKRKKDSSKIGLSSPQVEGQGTTMKEFDRKMVSSSRKKPKK